MKRTMKWLPVTVATVTLSAGLSACGGGGGGSVGDSGTVTNGQVTGSYYENAQVCFEDKIKKATCDVASPVVKTAADGSYSLKGQGAVVATIDTSVTRHEALGDKGSPVTQKLVFRAPAGRSAYVSAISTELAAAMDANGGDFADASKKLAAKIGTAEANLLADINKLGADDLAKLKAEAAEINDAIADAVAQGDSDDFGRALNGALARKKIQNVVVIFAENRGFDNLYGLFPGANGIPGVNPTSASSYIPQKDFDGSTLPVLPPTWGGMTVAGQSTVITQAQSANLPNKPFQIDDANSPITMSSAVITRDLVHRFYNNQMQINGGKNDKFTAYSDAGGLSMGYYDGSKMKLWNIAKQYTLADNFFMGTFGGSFLTHQYLICACAPTYPNADAATSPAKNSISAVTLDASGNLVGLTPGTGMPTSVLNGAPVYQKDSTITPKDAAGMFYAVNTMQPPYQPSGNSAGAVAAYADPSKATTLPTQSQTTIGDQLTIKGIDWAWYAGAWNAALADAPNASRSVIYSGKIQFQPHHQPFNYYSRFDPATATGAAERASHLKDFDASFLQDAAAGKLPPVAFYKPQGNLNQHPGYASVADGDAHIADVIAKLQASPQWKHMLIVVTYDENGGFWDHVAPPKGDRWGPGTRLPTLLVSPYAKKGFVDHTQYDTASILRFITHRYSLPVLDGITARDKALVANGGKPMGDLTGALTPVPQE
ncbi:Phosphoesterase family protein [Collimonas sp. OK242]|uniref:acid phosphatase n=1 Tax=Collimonas sp. OK242 TaxID=1798195 RepID=UPI00089BB88C|nr:acid phosphatase [Collimonas sp. OK242]SDY48991.1 Phosphoesterase family protein [Collimonas sp. OK242]